jgi:hypothetical protein
MENQEIKQRIKDYFVEIKEDKFTKVKTIKCKHKLTWKGKVLENKFMLTKKSYSNELEMGIDYRHKDNIDSVFFSFTYSNSDDGYPGMTNIKMYLILDDDKTIELSDASGFNHSNQSAKVGNDYISVYVETAQLAVSMSDFIAIANAKKIEYSFRFGQGSLENIFNEYELLVFKGFYNAAFDDDFESEYIFENLDVTNQDGRLLEDRIFVTNQDGRLLEDTILEIFLKEGKLSAIKKYMEITQNKFETAVNYISKFEDKAKNVLALKYDNPIENYFFVENRYPMIFKDSISSLELINNDSSGFWNKKMINQIDLKELKVGIKTNLDDKYPSLLVFPAALIFIKSNQIFQINYNKILSIDSKKSGLFGLLGSSIQLQSDTGYHKIAMTCDISLTIKIVAFFTKQMVANIGKTESISYLIESKI